MNGELWLLFGAAGLLTFLIRLSFIAAEGRFRAPAWFVAALPFVPIAALTALVAPELLLQAGSLNLGPRFWSGLVAIAMAAWQRNTLLTIASGFAALWLFSAF